MIEYFCFLFDLVFYYFALGLFSSIFILTLKKIPQECYISS